MRRSKAASPKSRSLKPKSITASADGIAATPPDREEWLPALRVALQKHGYSDPQLANVLEIQRRFGLAPIIDRESLRMAIRGERSPRNPEVRRHILEALEGVRTNLGGKRTARALKKILTEAEPFYRLDESTSSDTEFVLRGQLARAGRAGNTLRIQCMDDPHVEDRNGEEGVPAVEEARKHVFAANQLVSRDEADEVVILTNVVELVEPTITDPVAGVKLMAVAEFFEDFFDTQQALKFFQKEIQDRRFSGSEVGPEEGWLDQEFAINGRPSDRNNLIEQLTRRADIADRGRIRVLSGRAGAGKSTWAFRSACDLLDQWRQLIQYRKGKQHRLPVLVRGRSLGDRLTSQSLVQALVASLKDQYSYRYSEDAAAALLHEGYLFVIIDSVEETPRFDSLKKLRDFVSEIVRLDSSSDFLVTLRPEVFPHEDQDALAGYEGDARVEWLSLGALADDAVSKNASKLMVWLPTDGIHKNLLEPAFTTLLRRPLFHAIFSEERCRPDLTYLSMPTNRREDALRQNMALFSLFHRAAKRWARQAVDGFPITERHITPDHFLELCTLLVGVFAELAHRRTEKMRNGLMFPLREVLRLLESKRWRPIDRTEPLTSQELLKLLSYSTVFCRVRKDDTENGELCFPSTSLIAYFLAQYLVEPLDARDYDSTKNAQFVVDRLGAFSLGTIRLQYSQNEKGGGGDALAMVPMLVSGALEARGMSKRLETMLDDLRNPDTAHVRAEVSLKRQYVHTNPLGFLLIENLVLLAALESPHLTGQRPGRQADSAIDVSGLYLAPADLAVVNDIREGLIWSGSGGNLEFLNIGGSNAFDSKTRGLFARMAAPDLDFRSPRTSLVAYIEKLDREPAEEANRWMLVPGGVHSIGTYDNTALRYSLSSHGRRSLSFASVLLPSFLIQRQFVTNRDFLRFLKKAREWEPLGIRDETRNDYYLRTWDDVIHEMKFKPVWDWKEKEVEALGFTDWLSAPLVYVNWRAAKAYAHSHGWRLPTEVEYEAASRRFQDVETLATDATLSSSFYRSDLPWGAQLPDSNLSETPAHSLRGYAWFYDSSNSDEAVRLQRESPYLSAALSTPPKFDEWNKHLEEGLLEKGWPDFSIKHLLPAHHLVGGLRQWTEDVWSACSPAASLLSDLPGYPEPVVRTPLQDGLTVAHDSGKSAPRRETWAARTADNSMHRVLRGSSVHMAASFSRLTYRDAQLETNVNPDVGFRCVKVIWPSRSH